jgi:UDP-N-acetylmuramate dehydrogenase
MSLTGLKKDLERLTTVKLDEPMSRHTSFRLGGPADIFITASSSDEMRDFTGLAQLHDVPYLLLGGGTNILVADAGIRGLVIENRMRGRASFQQLEGTDTFLVRAQSGAPLARLVRQCIRRGAGGLEWAGGIPGTVGGAVVFNAGAFGHQLEQTIRGVELMAKDGMSYVLPPQELGLGYRQSYLSKSPREKRDFILSVEFLLQSEEPAILQQRLNQFDTKRRASQPRGRSAGSVFKNPPGDFAGRLIEAAGLKGERIGGAQISKKHANFIINRSDASAAQVAALINLVRERVASEFGIDMEPEIEAIGDWTQSGGTPW